MNTFRLQAALLLAGVPLLVSCSAQAQNPVPLQANQIQSATLLDSLFSDDGILQRDRAIPIWGQAAPGETVTVKLDNQTLTARADASGQWMVRVGPLPASTASHTLTVSTPTQAVTRRNLVYGDVWICSGQSNMEWGVGNLTDGKAEIAAANYPNIRLFTVPKKVAFTPQTELGNARWLVCNPDNVSQGQWNGFSAVGYFFGRKLNFNRGLEKEVLPALQEEGIGCIPFSPLAQGMLTSKYLGGEVPADSRAAKPKTFLSADNITEEKLAKVRQLNDIAQERGQTLAQMALAWVLRHQGMTSVLIGASKTKQLEDCVGCLGNLEFSDEELGEIDEIAPA